MTGTVYERWLAEFEEAQENPRSIATQHCPSCDSTALQLIFVVPSADSEVGWSEFWCDNCRQGVFFSRVQVSPGARRISMEERGASSQSVVPGYRVIPPEFSAD